MDTTIYATVLHPTRGYQQLRFTRSTISSAFDVLNQFVQGDHELLSAFLIDTSGCIRLPIAAFDGKPILNELQQLKHEWQEVLNP